MHASIALAAMDAGKHVYVQKPLCWSVDEARRLAKKAKDNPKIVTQMGNQGHSRDEARLGYEYITSGAIGDVREVHVWTNRPLGYWPQGVPRPAPLPARLQDPATAALRWKGPDVEARTAAALMGNYQPTDQLSWDLFLGVAPPVDYHPIYHPFNWRGWVDWGQGALGDMGAHLIDHPFWSLKLGMPTVIETRSTPFNAASYPSATTTYYEFPARGSMPPVKLTWYDGGFTPPKPDEIGDENLNGEGGIIYIGSKGKMMQETYGLNPRLLPDSKHASTPRPKQVLPRIPYEAHEMNFVDAIRGRQEISSPFEYAAQLTEVMLLGIVSLRAGGKIHYDAANRRITNKITQENNRDGGVDPNQYLSRDYRTGWTSLARSGGGTQRRVSPPFSFVASATERPTASPSSTSVTSPHPRSNCENWMTPAICACVRGHCRPQNGSTRMTATHQRRAQPTVSLEKVREAVGTSVASAGTI